MNKKFVGKVLSGVMSLTQSEISKKQNKMKLLTVDEIRDIVPQRWIKIKVVDTNNNPIVGEDVTIYDDMLHALDTVHEETGEIEIHFELVKKRVLLSKKTNSKGEVYWKNQEIPNYIFDHYKNSDYDWIKVHFSPMGNSAHKNNEIFIPRGTTYVELICKNDLIYAGSIPQEDIKYTSNIGNENISVESDYAKEHHVNHKYVYMNLDHYLYLPDDNALLEYILNNISGMTSNYQKLDFIQFISKRCIYDAYGRQDLDYKSIYDWKTDTIKSDAKIVWK